MLQDIDQYDLPGNIRYLLTKTHLVKKQLYHPYTKLLVLNEKDHSHNPIHILLHICSQYLPPTLD